VLSLLSCLEFKVHESLAYKRALRTQTLSTVISVVMVCLALSENVSENLAIVDVGRRIRLLISEFMERLAVIVEPKYVNSFATSSYV